MKGFLHWFKSSNKMKRWMFLILIGIILTCYGIAEILVLKEMSFEEVAKVIITFVIGFVAIVIGLVFLNKRTLELLIESTDDRMTDKKNVNLKSLIFNKKVYHQGPNIVVIGGGTGLNTVLTGLKKYTDNLTAIVTVSDYGKEESESRKELGVKPVDDIIDSIISLSTEEKEMENLLRYRFTEGKLNNISFADVYFSAMKNIYNDFPKSIIESNKILSIIGKVIPVTLDEMNITAELDNGYLVKEKDKIPQIVYEKVTKINRIYLTPSNCKATPGVVDIIKNADCIVIGPGSLYTNVIPNLLVNGISKAIKESTALKVYVSNIMTEPGQTDEYSVSDHLNAIIDHCGKGLIDYCIYDTGEIIPEFIKRYNLQGQDLVIPDIDKIKGITYLQRDLSMISNDCIRHDPDLVAASIIELICDDLKYQDKQNDPQYLMLNNKLREDKRISKIKKQMKKDNKKGNKRADNRQRGNSKFRSKYSERIASIREADNNMRSKEEKARFSNKKTTKRQPIKIERNEIVEDEDVLKFREEYEKILTKLESSKTQNKTKNLKGKRRKNKRGAHTK